MTVGYTWLTVWLASTGARIARQKVRWFLSKLNVDLPPPPPTKTYKNLHDGTI